MKNKIRYEWTLETIELGEIIDNDFSDKLDFDIAKVLDVPYYDLGLVRNEGNEIDGVNERYWAYVKEGKLPDNFKTAMGEDTGIKIPNRFHDELKKYLN